MVLFVPKLMYVAFGLHVTGGSGNTTVYGSGGRSHHTGHPNNNNGMVHGNGNKGDWMSSHPTSPQNVGHHLSMGTAHPTTAAAAKVGPISPTGSLPHGISNGSSLHLNTNNSSSTPTNKVIVEPRPPTRAPSGFTHQLQHTTNSTAQSGTQSIKAYVV
jgi:hypothetical protein